MSASGGADFASQSIQPVEQIAFPPFSGNLSVDEDLRFRCKNFTQVIGDFYKDKNITPLSQLTATPAFPTPHVLAQFANKTYTDYRTGETDAQYETRLALPDGWKLLTTASNGRWNNGYFGAAYWHPEHQQVVIAHRGTKFTNFGALWTNVLGVVFENHVPQMGSASTFAHEVVEVLQEVSRIKGVSFQLFFTGHSLGGWLAQITTFTTEYLKREENFFLRSIDDNDCFHPHTVVFESPGCKDMLSEMRDTFDVRLDGRSIDIENLDITSYLSAPNLINTYKSHLGTVYRLFTDLSGMGWWEKDFVFYTKATHDMDKIVEFFDSQTEQVHKDGKVPLKVHLVIDWPISAGFKGANEYENFFQWAKHLNDYHPDIKDVSFRHIFYCPIRYQTKLYNEQVNSFRIFSEEEQEFLQCCRWLRQWSEFFQTKELFSVMENTQAQRKAEEMLQSFQILNHTIRCTDASALQAFIPYVKRLLQLFPQIKESTKHALSSDRVRDKVYQFETRQYIKRISQSPLEFKPDASSYSEFLDNEQQKILHLQMTEGDEWTGLIKVYQVLEKTGCLSEGKYTILKLKRLLKVNQLMDLSTLMQSTLTQYLLLIACEDKQHLDEETKKVIRTLFDTIKQKPNIKIIFITRLGGSTVAFLHHMCKRISGEGFVRRVEGISWSDLTDSSQEKQLETSVKFQGARISLNKLMSAECAVATFLPLGTLPEDKEMTIGDPVPITNSYNESYYVGRTFRHQIAIKEDIFNDEDVRNAHMYLAKMEGEYKQLCQLHPESSVHWLEKDKSGKFLWQQSQGSLETLRRYVDTYSSPTYRADDLDKLLEQAQHQRVMMISDRAGMGKSTVLTHLSQQIKQKFPAKWVVRIDLNEHTDALKALKQGHVDKETAIEFVSEKVMKLKPGLGVELFKQCCEQKQNVRIVIMMDGFDEVSPFYKETVIHLLQALRQTEVEQLWVTTRPHLRKELEDKLQQLSYTLEPFSTKDQVKFLTKFWCLKDWFTDPEVKVEDVEKNKLEIYAEHLIMKLAKSISDKDREFTGIPLQTRMLAEAFDKEVKIFFQSAESIPELPFKLDLLGLYRQFIERKYDIYLEEKLQVSANNVIAILQRERDLKIMREEHQLLALKVLFTEEQVALFQNNTERFDSTEGIIRIGIVQVSHDGKLHFIHRTFAEYYVADYLVNRLTKGNNTSKHVHTFILKDIFLKGQNHVIRAFVDGILSSSKLSEEVLKQCGYLIHDLGNDCVLILNQAVRECNVNIFGLLSESLHAAEHTDTLVQLLLAPGNNRNTVWFMATERGNIQLLQKLWKCAKDNLRKEEINKLLLATNGRGSTVIHIGAERGEMEVLQKIWEWAEVNLTTEEINNKLLLAADDKGRTVWHVAAEKGKLESLQIIWEWAKENLTTDEINKLLLATDSMGRTAWHAAAEWGKLESLKKIWEWVKENLTKEEIKDKLLLATDLRRGTVCHMAITGGNLELLQKIWELAKENLTTEEIKNKLLLATDVWGINAWHHAAHSGNLDIFRKMWDWSNEVLTTDIIRNKLLLATAHGGRTVFHVAVQGRNLELLQKISEWAKENLTMQETYNELLLATDNRGMTAWHEAAECAKAEILQKLWQLAKENLATEVIKNKLLLATNDIGRTAWHMAGERGNLEAMQKIWEWAKENLTTEEIRNKLLLAKNNVGRTFWQEATEWNTPELLRKLREWAGDYLTKEEINMFYYWPQNLED